MRPTTLADPAGRGPAGRPILCPGGRLSESVEVAGGEQIRVALAALRGDVGERLLDLVLVPLGQADRPDVLTDVAGLLVVGALARRSIHEIAAVAAARPRAAELRARREGADRDLQRVERPALDV